MSFQSLSVLNRGVILIFCSLILFCYFYIFLKLLTLARRAVSMLFPGLMLFLCFELFQLLVKIQEGDFVPDFEIPIWLILPGLVLLAIYAFLLLGYIRRWQKQHISAMSVKEAIDRLPTGLLISSEGGIPIMLNETMQHICRDRFGKSVMVGTAFYENLRASSQIKEADEDDTLLIRDGSGRVYDIRKKVLIVDGVRLTELSAVDVDREYKLTEELKERREKARELNSRLKNLMATIEYVTMNRELLKLKTDLHNNIGQCILTAKRYVLAPNSVDQDHMLAFWKQNIRHLIDDKPEEWEQPYYVISKEAGRLGIDLDLIGELPDEQKLIPIVDAAISVHIGNTIKHADGTKVTIAVRKSAENYVISFTNDGKQPDKEIREKGGLLNLRHEVETVGGSMELISQPAFELKITLPGKDKGYGL